MLQFRGGFAGKIQFGNALSGEGIKKAQDDFFSRHRRIGRHADVALPIEVVFVNTTILGHGFLIGFQAGEKFDAPEDPLGEVGGKLGRRSHQAVQAEGNRRAALVHLQMNVAGGSALGLVDQLLDDFRRGSFRIFRAWNCLLAGNDGWLEGFHGGS